MFSRSQNASWTESEPRAKRWAYLCRKEQRLDQLQAYRKRLDKMTVDQVLWTPFGAPASYPPQSFFSGTLRYTTECNEAYMPDRVTRQFGRIQGIPKSIIQIGRDANLGPLCTSYRKDYGNFDHCWTDILTHHHDPSALGRKARVASECEPDYLGWFLPRTHPKVWNEERFGENTMVNATLNSFQARREQTLRFSLRQLIAEAEQDVMIPAHWRNRFQEMSQVLGTGGMARTAQPDNDSWWGQTETFAQHHFDDQFNYDQGHGYGNPQNPYPPQPPNYDDYY